MKNKKIVILSVLMLTQYCLGLNAAEIPQTPVSVVDTKEGINSQAPDKQAMLKAHAQLQAKISKQLDGEEKPTWSEKQSRQAILEKKYKKAIAEDPDNSKNYRDLAGLYLYNSKNQLAVDAYQDAITHDPENPKLFAAISIAYLHEGKFSMAKAMVDEALRLNPEMQHVAKINEYIVAKQAAMEAASQIDLNHNKTDMNDLQVPATVKHFIESGSDEKKSGAD